MSYKEIITKYINNKLFREQEIYYLGYRKGLFCNCCNKKESNCNCNTIDHKNYREQILEWRKSI